ncbi:MAG TPA: DNA recombination protein RmuC [Chloroflexota bacterium]|nr:DNA recombination protein RmuC [Chloroflexota bacterium]
MTAPVLLAALTLLLVLVIVLGVWYLRDMAARLLTLQAYAQARQDSERAAAESIRRLEGVLAGSYSKGAAGERVLEQALAQLPAEWQVRDFRVGNKVVEFGLRLPNDLILPVDSKWPASALLQAFDASESSDERVRLKRQIESVVLQKAQEVRKYVDPRLTVPYCVAAVPDAVYDLCWGTQVDLLRRNVVLISYSLFLPYLLLVFQTALKAPRAVDADELEAALDGAQDGLRAAQEELEGRLARAIIMLGNAREDLSSHLRRARRSLGSLDAAGEGAIPR